jgi:ribosomal protein L37AE/L43A
MVLLQLKRKDMSEKIEMSDVVKKMREVEISLTGKRFCSSCQTMQPATLGKMLEGKIRRWKCGSCLANISKPIYKSKEKV